MGGDGLKAKAVKGSGEIYSFGKSGVSTWFSFFFFLFIHVFSTTLGSEGSEEGENQDQQRKREPKFFLLSGQP